MSAFMVEDKTINRVVSWLSDDQEGDWIKRRLDIHLADNENSQEFRQSLFQMNIDGVNARYGEDESKEFRPLEYKFRYELTNQFQVLKSLQCLLYQCSEGDVPETELYKTMKDYEHSMAMRIVRNLPQYDKAQWG